MIRVTAYRVFMACDIYLQHARPIVVSWPTEEAFATAIRRLRMRFMILCTTVRMSQSPPTPCTTR